MLICTLHSQLRRLLNSVCYLKERKAWLLGKVREKPSSPGNLRFHLLSVVEIIEVVFSDILWRVPSAVDRLGDFPVEIHLHYHAWIMTNWMPGVSGSLEFTTCQLYTLAANLVNSFLLALSGMGMAAGKCRSQKGDRILVSWGEWPLAPGIVEMWCLNTSVSCPMPSVALLQFLRYTALSIKGEAAYMPINIGPCMYLSLAGTTKSIFWA